VIHSPSGSWKSVVKQQRNHTTASAELFACGLQGSFVSSALRYKEFNLTKLCIFELRNLRVRDPPITHHRMYTKHASQYTTLQILWRDGNLAYMIYQLESDHWIASRSSYFTSTHMSYYLIHTKYLDFRNYTNSWLTSTAGVNSVCVCVCVCVQLYIPSPIHFMEWYLVMYRDNFAYSFFFKKFLLRTIADMKHHCSVTPHSQLNNLITAFRIKMEFQTAIRLIHYRCSSHNHR